MFTVRVVQATDPGKPVMSRDNHGMTKNEALTFIERLGKLSTITRFDKLYIVTPSKRN
jgi:hypothetical protein